MSLDVSPLLSDLSASIPLTSSSPQSLLFIDSSVADYGSLLSGLQPGITPILLDANQDGIQQITAALSDRTNITSIHILSHGFQGGVQLGNSLLTASTLDHYTSQLQSWQSALTADADILFYGCNVGFSDQGASLLSSVASLTGADIAASTDLTGASSLGGNWELEAQTGTIEASLAFTLDVLAGYSEVLINKIIINEFYRGGSFVGLPPTDEFIELLLVQDMTATELNTFFVGDSTAAKASKFAAYDFTNMDSIATIFRAGTLIVVGGTASITEDTSYNPAGGDWTIALNTGGAFLPNANPGDNGNFAGDDLAWVDTTSTGSTISTDGFAIDIGTAVGAFTAAANLDFGASTNNTGYALNTDLAGVTNTANWTTGIALASTTPGQPNGGANTVYINSLRIIPPVVTLAGTAPQYAENQAAVVIADAATVTDADSANFDTGTLTARFTVGGVAADRLTISPNATVTLNGQRISVGGTEIGTFRGGLGTAEDLVVTLNANATPALTQSLLRRIAYSNAGEVLPASGSRTVEVVLTDGDGGTSAAVTRTIAIVAPGVGNNNDAPIIGNRTVLYDGSLGGAPSALILPFIQNPAGAVTPVVGGGGVTIDTTSNSGISAGYFGNPFVTPTLNRANGYTLSFTAQVLAESRVATANKNNDGKDDRAGFSVIVLSSDLQGIELGFWTNRIWAQDDGTTQTDPSLEPDDAPFDNTRTLFTQAEFNSTVDNTVLRNYDLTVLGNTYSLFADGILVLSGRLRNYTAFNKAPDPYETPNLIFFGDNTASAQAQFRLNAISVTTNVALTAQTVNEDTPLVVTNIQIADVDAPPNPVTVTLAVSNGILTVNNAVANGVTPGNITNNGTATVTLVGTISQINTTLANATGLIYQGAVNFSGAETLTVTVNDGGNTEGLPQITTRTKTITVTGVNDPPTVAAPGAIAVLEDQASPLTGISFADPDAAAGTVTATFAVGVGTLAATTVGGVTVGGTATNRTLSGTLANINAFLAAGNLTYTTALNSVAAQTLGVSINDGGNTGTGGALDSGVTNVTLNITAVNDAPSFANAGNQTLAPGTNTLQTVANWANTFVFGPADEAGQAVDAFLVTVTSDPNNIFTTAPAVANNGTLTYTPNGTAGTATVEVRLRDNGGTANGGVNLSPIATFTITVGTNNPPVFVTATLNGTNGDITVPEGSIVTLLATATDAEADTLTFTLDGTAAGAIAGAAGSTRTSNPIDRTVTDNGSNLITFIVNDGLAPNVTATRTITVTNVAPTATFANGGAVPEGSTGTVSFTAQTDPSAVDTAAGFRYAYDFNNDGTFEIGDGTYAGSVIAATATVPATFLAAGPGTRTVRGRILDKDGGFTDYTTDITITNVAPTITEGATTTVTMTEDSAPTPFALTLNATDPGTADTLTWSILTPATNGTAAVSATPTGNSQVISYVPNANVNGTDSFIVQVNDGNGGIAQITVNVNITAVNDAPSFANAGNQTLAAGTNTLQTVANWANTFVFGPADEAGQAVDAFLVTVTSDPNNIFTTAPAVANNGTLTYTPNGTAGTATVEVRLRDNGGTANGGVDLSPVATFTITVGAAAPTLSIAPGITPVENTLTNGTFTLVLNQPAPAGGLTVNFTLGGTATGNGTDYTLVAGAGITAVDTVAGTFTIAAGATTATLIVQVVDDLAAEADETVALTLTAVGGGYTLGTTAATLTIAANDTTVTTTNDAGEGSLRQAILNANAFAGDDTINFFLPAGAQTINLLTGLPSLTGTISILNTTGANNLTLQGTAAVGSVFDISPGATATLNQITVQGGGSLFGISNGGTLNVSNSLIRDAIASNISNTGTITLLSNTSLIGANRSIGNDTSGVIALIDNSLFTGSTAGYAIENRGAIGTISNSTIRQNQNGIFNILPFVGSPTFGTITTISNTTIENNGTGIRNDGSITTIENSTITGQSGTGIVMFADGVINAISNTTVSTNLGGGISITDNSSITEIRNSTVAGNNVSGISVFVNANIANLVNSIIAGNGGGANLVGTAPVNASNNLLGVSFAAVGLDSTLADNGGTTRTHALLPGSPAIDAAGAGATATDQRGIAAVGTRDIGAFESRKFTIATTGGTPQSTLINTAFANPLGIQVTSAFGEPVAGGVVTYTPPAAGASAALSSATATLDATGNASVTATANGTAGGAYTVSAGASGITNSANFSLTNTLTPNTPPTLATATLNGTNGDITVPEGSIVTLLATATDAEADTLTFTLDGTAAGAIAGAAGSTRTSNPIDRTVTDNGSNLITFIVNDGLAPNVTATRTIIVTNVSPTATFANGGAVPEGSTGTVSFTAQTDPSAIDTAAGFRYAYDFNNDGTFEIGDGTYAGSVIGATATVPATFLAAGPGTRTVRGRILDKDGGFTDYTTDITITNVAPTITAGAATTVTMTEDSTPTPFALTLNATDPGTTDILTWSILTNATNGTASVSATPTGNSQVINYVPNANVNGTDSFVVQVNDGDGGTAQITVNVNIIAVNDAPSFANAGNQTLAAGTNTLQTVANWANTFVFGPADEAGQAVDAFLVTVTSDPNSIFTTAPAVANNGTLTYTPNGTAGTATVEVRLRDNGGTANGGVDLSPVATFTITIGANTPPTVTGSIPAIVVEQDAPNTTIDLSAFFADAQSGSAGLTYTVVNNTNSSLFTSATIVGSTLTLDYAPTGTGTSTLTLRATDPQGAFVETSVAITVNPPTPPIPPSSTLPYGITHLQDLGSTSGIYQVGGNPGELVALQFDWVARDAAFNNELGFIVVDDAIGTINGIAPGDPSYARTALASSRRRVLFRSGETAGAGVDLTVAGGSFLLFYLVQNTTTENWLATNPSNNTSGTLALFSREVVNLGQFDQVRDRALSPGSLELAWEDIGGGGDRDFNDAIIRITPGAYRVPGTTGTTPVRVEITQSDALFNNELGFFYVDDPTGRIGTLRPGDAGYTAAAFASGNFQTLIPSGQRRGASATPALQAGRFVGWYLIQNASTADFILRNLVNRLDNAPVAFFSFIAANPDGVDHFRRVSADEFGFEDLTGGGDRDFNDVVFRVQ